MSDPSAGAAFLPAAHFTPGRQGGTITDLVLHWMDTNLAGADATFTSGGRQASAHYGIEDGVVHQYVKEGDTAWHAGNWTENLRSIGIEHSAAPGRPASAATVATSIALCAALCRKYRIDPAHIYPHNRFFGTQCPGTLPLETIRAGVVAELTGHGTSAPPPVTQQPPPPPSVQEDKMYLIAKNANGPDIWRGDGITRTQFPTMKSIEDFKYVANKAGKTITDLGAVADLDAIGAPAAVVDVVAIAAAVATKVSAAISAAKPA